MILENEILKLRAVEPEDLDILYAWENNTGLWIHGNTLSPYSKLALRQYIEDAQKMDIYQCKQLRLMIIQKEDESIAGAIDLYDFDVRNLRAGVGILIDEKYRNRQYAYQSLEIIKEYCFGFLHMHQLYAYILINNDISTKLFEKAGFTKSGILTDWVYPDKQYSDVYIYQLINNIGK